MEGIEVEEEQLLNLSLSLVSNTYAGSDHSKRRKMNGYDLSTSSDGGEYDDQGEIFRLLQIREEMLNLANNRSCLLQGVQLIHLLLKSATSVHEHISFTSSMADLINLYQNVSLTGDSAQRLSAYYTDGLTARLLTEKSPFYSMIMKHPSPAEEFMAFTNLYRVSPCYQFSHFTANQAILEMFEKEEGRNGWELHVIDFDLAYGLQWPSLIQSLSEKATTEISISLRITGFARSLEELVETEARLVSFAKGFRNMVFEFQLRGTKVVDRCFLRRRGNETVAVNLVSHMHTSNNNVLRIFDMVGSIGSLGSFYPSIVVLVQRGGRDRSCSSFVGRFMESLHYYAAMFDSLDDCLPRDSLERLCIEKNHLGREIKSEMGCSVGFDSIGSEGFEGMEGKGFVGIELSSRTMMQAKLLLRMRSHYQPQFEGDCGGGFRVFERDDGKAISLGWQDRVLVTATAWQSV